MPVDRRKTGTTSASSPSSVLIRKVHYTHSFAATHNHKTDIQHHDELDCSDLDAPRVDTADGIGQFVH